MRKIIAKYILVFLGICLVILPGCFDDDIDPIKIIVTCSGTDGSFYGSYIKNEGSSVDFTGTKISGTNSLQIYTYEVELEDVDEVEISATKNSSSSTLSIIILKNDTLVKESVVGNGYTTITYTYEYE